MAAPLAAAASPNFLAQLGMSLGTSLGVAGLGKVLGLGNTEDPADRLGEFAELFQKEFGAEATAEEATALAGLIEGSGIGRRMVTQAARSGAIAQRAAAATSARSGLDRTGVGATVAGIGASVGGSNVSDALGAILQMALEQTGRSQAERLRTLSFVGNNLRLGERNPYLGSMFAATASSLADTAGRFGR